MSVDGQLWFVTGLGLKPPSLAGHVNSDGTSAVQMQQFRLSTGQLDGQGIVDIDADPAAGFYFVMDTASDTSNHSTNDPTSVSLISYRMSDNTQVDFTKIGDHTDLDLTQALAVDPYNHVIYVAQWGIDLAHSGIMKVSYNPLTGALQDATAPSGRFEDTASNFFLSGTTAGAVAVNDIRYITLDLPDHLLYYTANSNGYDTAPFGTAANGVFVTDLNGNGTAVQLTSTTQFPHGSQSGGANDSDPNRFAGVDANGFIGPIAVDAADHKVYFLTHSIHPTTGDPADALWYVSTTGGANQTAIKVTGITVDFAGENGGLSFDPQTRTLYISNQNQSAIQPQPSKATIIIAHLNADGTAVSSTQTISMATLTGVSGTDPNTGEGLPDQYNVPSGTSFFNLPVLTVTGTGTHPVEQSGSVTLATSFTSSDIDSGYYASATVQITGGTFSSNENSTADDHLSVNLTTSGGKLVIGGVASNITASYDSATEKLTLSGYDTVAHYNIAMAAVQYNTTGDNPTNYGSNTTRTVTWTVSDGEPNIPAGSQNSGTTTITINAVNDAPVIASLAAQTFNEDATTAFSGIPVSIVTDVDANPATQNIIVALSVTHGTLTVPTNVGGGIGAGGVVGSGTSTVTLTGTQNQINTTLHAASGLTYVSATDYNGADTLTITVNDQDNTGSGGAQQVSSQIAITVNAVNDAPAGADNSKTILEDNTYTFAAADFGFSDPVDAANGAHGADTFLAVKITSLPTAGTLTLSGGAVTTGQVVTVANIPNLVFTPVANANGTNYSHFTFQVEDNGGTANGGVDLDQSANTFTFNVTPVNDAPAGTNKAVAVNEDAAYTFTTADFGFTDPSDSPANNLTAVKITTLPGTGSLTDNGVAVSGGQSISVADITGNKLVFTPVANGNGAPYTTFTFQVQDDGGTANGGADLDLSPNTMTVNVTSINDAPAGADKAITTNEDTAYTFTAADFGFTDPNDSPANTLAGVKIATLFGAGSLTDNNVAVTAGQVISIADITGNKLKFAPAANASGNGYASFTFQVQDNGGTANGGVDLDQSANTITVNVTSVNDAPAGTNNSKTINEDGSYTFAAADFGFSDPNDSSANAFTAVTITLLPTAGTLALNGVTVTAGQSIAVANIPTLVFTPVANANGTNYSHFTFQVQDDGGTANSGVDLDQSANTFTFNVTSVNDAPVGTANTVATNEDTPYVFSAADFGFSDPTDSPADALAAVKITTLPGVGTLTDNNVVVTAGQLVTALDITNGLLKFVPAANAHGTSYASFTFQVEDNGGTGNGGVDLDTTARAMTVNVNSVNDAPAGTDKTVSVNAPADYVFGAADFGFSDPNDSPADAFVAVKIAQLPTHGTLTLTGSGAVTAGEFIQETDIVAGKLIFTPDSLFAGPDTGLTFQVQDNGGTANGGGDLDPTANTFTINVKVANSEPAGTNGTVGVHADTAYTFTAADFGFTDTADTPANDFLAVEITTLPLVASGVLTNNGTPVVAGNLVSVTDINAGHLVFTPTPAVAVDGSFTFQVQDDGGTANGGVDLDQSPNTLSVHIESANHAPAGADNSQAINEDTSYTFAVSDFSFSDAGDTPADHFKAVEITAAPTGGTLTDNNVAVTSGQSISVADIAGGLLKFTPTANANGALETSFTFQVQDDGGTANSGVDLDQSPNTFTFNVTSVNDAPVGTGNTVSANEDGAHVFTSAEFGFTDPNDTPPGTLLSVKITTLPGAGALTNNGAAVNAGDFVLASEIDLGKLVFTPAANANGAGYAAFTFQVRDDGGTGNGGVDLDQTPRIMTVDVTAVNDAPAGADNSKTINEGATYTFGTADFGFTDPVDAASASGANALLAVKIATVPDAGTLTNDGIAVNPGDSVFASAIAANKLVFTPAANGNGAPYTTFTFQVQDNGGGADLDQSANTFTLNVTSVNDAPAGANNTVTANEDGSYTFAAADFGFSDTNDSPANNLTAVQIATLPGAGALTDNGLAVSAGQFISLADITGNKLVFTPDANTSGAGYASFTFQVRDDGGTANGGVDLDPSANTMTIDVTSVNDAPSGADHAVTIDEDTSYTFAAADFGFTDPDDSPTNALLAIRITTLPGAGTLTNNGGTVNSGDFVLAADIAANKLVFTPAANGNGVPFTSFAFQVQDDGGIANGGVDLDQSANTFTLNVTSVNDAPAGADKTVTTNEDTNYTFTATDFGFTDPNDSPANSLAAVKIASISGAGSLTDDNVAVIAGQFIPLADITSGLLKFAPAPDANGAGYASFTFQVQDDGGSANSSVDLDPSANTMTIDVAAVNDPPTLANVATSAAYPPGGAPVVLSPALTIGDIDSPTLSGATVRINSATTFLGDVLAAFGQTNGAVPGHAGITAVYNPGSATLTLTGVASLAEYQDVLQHITFQSTNATPTNGGANALRTVEWQVNDGSGVNNLSNVPTTDIRLHTLDLDGNDSTALGTAFKSTFTEHGTAVAIVDSDVAIGDVDSSTMASATITLTNHSNGDSLSVAGALSNGIVASSYNSSTGVLTLTGSTTTANYLAALQQLRYSNSTGDPDSSDRDITVVIRDSLNVDTNPAHATVSIVTVNDAPALSAAGGVLAYTENQAATAIDPAFDLSDIDSVNMTSATVAITGNFHAGEDVLGFTNQNGIAGLYDPATGVLTLSNVSSAASYEAALRSVTYFNTSENPSGDTRTISYSIDDGSAQNHASNTATTTVGVTPVDDAPVAAAGAASGNEGTAIHGTLVATDVDSDSITYSRVAQAAHGTVAVDPDGSFAYTPSLGFSGTDSFTFKANDGSLDSNTATWTLTVNSTTPHNAIWEGSPDLGTRAPPFQVAGLGDFNHDGTDDVLWYNASTSAVDEWVLANGQWTASIDLGAHAGERVAGVGDFNGDGTDDVLWRDPNTGAVDEWVMHDGQWQNSVSLGSRGTDWQIVGTGDFNHDGTADVLWRNPTNGHVDLWLMANGNWSSSVDLGSRSADWQVAGVGDFNNDGTSDVLWRNQVTGALDEWRMGNGQWAGSENLGSRSTDLQIAGIGDFNHDGTSDVLWRNPTTGTMDGWVMAHGQWFSSIPFGPFDPAYTVAGIGNLNHAAGDDVLWHNPASGQTGAWLLGPS